MKRLITLLVTLVCVALSSEHAVAYLKLGTRVGTETKNLKWQEFPVRYFVTDAAGGGVSATQLRDTVSRAFNAWTSVETASVAAEFAGMTNARPNDDDGMTVIGFQNRPDQDRTLGATSFLVDTLSGEIVEAEIYLNSFFPWSVAAAGESKRYDLESIVLHEVGHLLGLGHSALGETQLQSGGRTVLAAEAVMFPIAFPAGSIVGRTLRADDIAGISDIYSSPTYRRERGSISGHVTKNGQGVLGAHVVAFNLRTGKLVGGFALNEEGEYVIAGLESGPHAIRVEPLDDGDIESFFDLTLDIDANFRAKFHDRIVVVPRGGGRSDVDIKVESK